MDYEAVFKSVLNAIFGFLKKNLIRMIVVAGIVVFILIVIAATRAFKAETVAKLTSKVPAVSNGEVLTLCNNRDLWDTLVSTEDPDTPSTSEQNTLSQTIRENAATAVDNLVSQKKLTRDEAMDNLFMLEKDSDQTVKDTATAGLATLAEQSDGNLQVLVKKLGDGDPDVRTAAGNALGKVKGARASSLVAPLLKDTDASSAAQTALQNIGPDAIPYLLPMLNGASDDLRAQLVTTIGNIGDEGGTQDIVDQCNTTPVISNVHRLAILALANIILKSYPPNASLSFDTSQPPATPRVIKPTDTASAQLAEPVFTKALADTKEDNFARARSALALGRIGGTEAANQLVSILPDYDERVVSAATSGLVEVGPTAVPVLKEAMSNSNVQVRIAAANAVGEISDSPALAAIGTALHDKSADVREAAVTSLGIGGNPASVPLLTSMLADPSGNVGLAATESLHMIGKPAIPALVALLGSPSLVEALHASGALRMIGVAAQPAIVQALNSGSDTQRAWAAFTLGQLGDHDAVPALQEIASSNMPRAKFAAQQALEQLGTL